MHRYFSDTTLDVHCYFIEKERPAFLQASHSIALNGTVTGTTSFPIPSASLLNGLNAQSASSGSTTESYNVWTNGAGSFRSQQVSSGGETDLYVNPGSVWLWDSSTLTATNEQPGSQPAASTPVSNPELAASQIIAKLSAYSTLSVSGNMMVAGQPAYTLSLVPTVSDSLVGSIQIAVDSQTHVPVQIQIFPKGSAWPAASLGFDTLAVASQPSSVFSFTPPPGATVVTAAKPSTSTGTGSTGTTKVLGTGFDSVMIATPSAKMLSSLGAIEKLLPTISTSSGVSHLYSTPIFQAIVLPDGTVVAGAVDTARLLQVAAGL